MAAIRERLLITNKHPFIFAIGCVYFIENLAIRCKEFYPLFIVFKCTILISELTPIGLNRLDSTLQLEKMKSVCHCTLPITYTLLNRASATIKHCLLQDRGKVRNLSISMVSFCIYQSLQGARFVLIENKYTV